MDVLIEDLFTGSYLFRLSSDRMAILLTNKNIAQPVAPHDRGTVSLVLIIQPKNIEVLRLLFTAPRYVIGAVKDRLQKIAGMNLIVPIKTSRQFK